MPNLVKYLLFITNFLVFILGITVFGAGIWVLVDKPSFLNLFNQAQEVSGLNDDFNIEIYTSAAYTLLIVSLIIVVLSFFGCCGAIKQSKCMLGTYFTLILAMFIAMVVGAVLAYSGNLEETIKNPLKNALTYYNDNPSQEQDIAYKNVWNEVQKELKCCGVDSVADWQDGTSHDWQPSDANKPIGCCEIFKNGTEIVDETEQMKCRKLNPSTADNPTYYFRGCFTMIKDKIESNQKTLAGVAIGVLIVMFLNMLFSFAMCTMVE